MLRHFRFALFSQILKILLSDTAQRHSFPESNPQPVPFTVTRMYRCAVTGLKNVRLEP